MKTLQLKSLYAIIMVLVATGVKAQDIHFSQFFETPLYRNPALAGIVNADVRVQTVYRSQWNSIANAYKTTSVNAEYKLPVTGDDFLTLGMQVYHDRAGSTNLTTTHVLPVLNYHKSVSSTRNMYLSVGFMGGWVQRRIDRSKMTTNTTYERGDDGETGFNQQFRYLDGSVGISLNSQIGDNPDNNIVIGAALHHFNKPKSSFYNNEQVVIDPKTVFSADLRTHMSEYAMLTIHNDYVQQGNNREILSGALMGLKFGPYSDEPTFILSGGAFYRWNDALIPALQLDVRPFKFSMTYDINISKLYPTTYGRGGFELSASYQGMLDRDNSSANAVLCPRF